MSKRPREHDELELTSEPPRKKVKLGIARYEKEDKQNPLNAWNVLVNQKLNRLPLSIHMIQDLIGASGYRKQHTFDAFKGLVKNEYAAVKSLFNTSSLELFALFREYDQSQLINYCNQEELIDYHDVLELSTVNARRVRHSFNIINPFTVTIECQQSDDADSSFDRVERLKKWFRENNWRGEYKDSQVFSDLNPTTEFIFFELVMLIDVTQTIATNNQTFINMKANIKEALDWVIDLELDESEPKDYNSDLMLPIDEQAYVIIPFKIDTVISIPDNQLDNRINSLLDRFYYFFNKVTKMVKDVMVTGVFNEGDPLNPGNEILAVIVYIKDEVVNGKSMAKTEGLLNSFVNFVIECVNNRECCHHYSIASNLRDEQKTLITAGLFREAKVESELCVQGRIPSAINELIVKKFKPL